MDKGRYDFARSRDGAGKASDLQLSWKRARLPNRCQWASRQALPRRCHLRYRGRAMELIEPDTVRLLPGEHKCGQRVVDLTFSPVDDRLECVAFAVKPLPGGAAHPLKAAQLRECLAIASLVEKARRFYIRTGHVPGLEVDRAELRSLAERGLKGTRRRLPPEHFATVAEEYARAVLDDRPPTRAVAERFRTSHSTAAKWVDTARQLDLLQKTKRGQRSSGLVRHGEASLGGRSSFTADATVETRGDSDAEEE